MEWSIPAAMLGFNVAHAVATAAIALYARKVARAKNVDQRFSDLEADVSCRAKKTELQTLRQDIDRGCDAHQRQLAAAELSMTQIRGELNRLPTQGQIDTLQQSIVGLSGALSNTQGRLEGINRAVDLINEFLINQGGAKNGAKS